MDKKELKNKLSEASYIVTQEHGTEAPFSGELLDIKDDGTFVCVCCQNKLFSSKTKYDSGTGWPSFWQPFNETSVKNYEDRSHGMVRVEVRCFACDAHLGHVFPDGPEPTGLRLSLIHI